MKMTPEQFAFWLQGYVELTGGTPPTQEQWDSIVEHLGLLFNKVTKPVAKKEQAKEILIEKAAPTKATPADEQKETKSPSVIDDYEKIFKKQLDEWERINRETQPGVPYQYPPFVPPSTYPTLPYTPSPNWPGNGIGDWYEPNGFPKIIC